MHLFNEHTNSLDVFRINQNSLIFSSLREYYQPARSQGFAIKYVAEGVERYKLNGKDYPITSGKYLLTNETYEGNVEIEAQKNVNGICINLTPQLISEVLASKKRPDTAYSDNELVRYFTSVHFLDNQYTDTQTHLGRLLKSLALKAYEQNIDKEELTTEFFYIIAEKIIDDQQPVYTKLQTIPGLKAATKKDLYRRLERGKEYVDNCFMHPLTIDIIAREACMSEYHFFRLFKSVFGLSPNQYLIRKRLEHGRNMLAQDRYSVSAAAIESGFSDIHTFSKAFKKQFGMPPSHLIK
jgi:AraC-like DNA-binding protein